MQIGGEEFMLLKDYVSTGKCHYTHKVSLLRAIKTLGFPAKKLGARWYVNVNEADMWMKRRMQDPEAS